MNPIVRMLDPTAIAVLGATGDLTRPGGQVVRALNEHGYRGAVYPVNPKYPELAGRRCYASIADIDGPCDLAVIALPAALAAGMVEQCGRKGIRGAVVLGGGFRESGTDGARHEAAMLAAARAHDVRLIGPNCLGFVNVHSRAYAAFGSLTRPPLLAPGPVSAVIQSGGFGVSMILRCAAAGVGFRQVVASGNETDIGAPELIDAYVDDPGTRVIVAYLEGVSDGRALMAAARRALAAGKPIVVLKAGNTDQGRIAAASHTANLTGSYDIYRAAFRQCGITMAQDIDHVADAALCFTAGRLPRGRGVALMGGSGGSAAVFADAADEVGLRLAPLTEETVAVLRANLPPVGSFKNPVDYTAGYPRADSAEQFLRAFRAVAADPSIDTLALMFATAGATQLEIGADLLAQVAAERDKTVITFSAMTEQTAPKGLARLREAGIPTLPTPRRVALALGALADYADARTAAARGAQAAPAGIALDLPPGAATLDEHEGKRLLAQAGIAVTRDALLPVDGDTRLPAGMSFPVAVKIVAREIAHKSDIGCVRLNIHTAEELTTAARDVVANARRAAPEARLAGVLVSEMIGDGVETIVGVVNDACFGPVVAFGLGGVTAEVLRDVAYRVAPFGLAEARAMIGELRGVKLLTGFRGRPPCDLEALAQVLVRVSQLATAHAARLAELDINPLLVRPQGRGVAAADALVVLR